MPLSVDDSQQSKPLVTSNEPKGPKRKGGKGSMGEQAFNDAVLAVGIAWLILFILVFSLRSYNI